MPADPKSDYKALRLSIHGMMPLRETKLDRALTLIFVSDPRMVGFIGAATRMTDRTV